MHAAVFLVLKQVFICRLPRSASCGAVVLAGRGERGAPQATPVRDGHLQRPHSGIQGPQGQQRTKEVFNDAQAFPRYPIFIVEKTHQQCFTVYNG